MPLRPTFFLLILFVGTASGHDYWLVPDTHSPKPGQEIGVKLVVGSDFSIEQERPWQPNRTSKLDLIAQGKVLDIRSPKRVEDKPAVRLSIPMPGTAIIRMDRDWSNITMKPEAFHAYLEEEGLIEVIAERKKLGEDKMDGRERYQRCLKSILQVGEPLDDSPCNPLRQALEILPDTNPGKIKAGESLTFRLLYDGKPVHGLAVVLGRREGDKLARFSARTNAEGKVTFKIPANGPWLIRTVHMKRSTDPNADWESTWAALTFAVP